LSKINNNRIGLGSVQFGLNYGISNAAGKTTDIEVKKILNLAFKNKIDTIDTAFSYGSSEKVLGKNIENKKKFKIVTKISPIGSNNITEQHVKQVEREFNLSLERLGMDSIYGLLFHRADDFYTSGIEKIYQKLTKLKAVGKIKKIGASIYSYSQLEYILERFPVDLVQLPFNIFDQRLSNLKAFKLLNDANVEIHSRSTFLQGLIFIEPSELPSHLSPFQSKLRLLNDYANDNHTSKLAVAIAFVLQQTEINKCILGFETSVQLQEFLNTLGNLPCLDPSFYKLMAVSDDRVLNPVNW